MRPALQRWLMVAGMATTGCLETLTPEVGGVIAPACDNEDSDPGQVVSFARDLLGGAFRRGVPSCLQCHSPGGATPIGIVIGGLDLSSRDGLLRGGARGGADVVVPGDACGSILVQKLGDGPPFGARMPLEGPALGDPDVQLIVDWIVEGADDN